MSSLFDQDRVIWHGVNKFADIVCVNLLFLVSCVPIITIGTAMSAMYYTLMKSVRKNRGYLFKNYIHAFKINLKQGIPSFFIIGILMALAAVGAYARWGEAVESQSAQFEFWISGIVLLLLVCLCMYFYPVLSRFNFSFKNLFVFSALIMFKYFYFTIMFFAVLVACVYLVFMVPGFFIPCFIIFLPALGTYVASFAIEKIFKVYMPRFENGNNPSESSDQWYYD